MTNKTNDLNAKLFSNELFDFWSNHTNLNTVERHLLKTYLKDTTKNVLEAGTGGGRVAFEVEDMGFKAITAYDFVPKMISHANNMAKEKKSNINFMVADATHLENFKNQSFDYLLYFEQILCLIDKEVLFAKALEEAYRVAKKDGIIIFSFLDFSSRFYNPVLSAVVNILRKIRGEETSKHHLPWLKHDQKINWKLFNKNQPRTYWVNRDEIISQLKSIGFSILEAKNYNQFYNNTDKGNGMILFY